MWHGQNIWAFSSDSCVHAYVTPACPALPCYCRDSKMASLSASGAQTGVASTASVSSSLTLLLRSRHKYRAGFGTVSTACSSQTSKHWRAMLPSMAGCRPSARRGTACAWVHGATSGGCSIRRGRWQRTESLRWRLSRVGGGAVTTCLFEHCNKCRTSSG